MMFKQLLINHTCITRLLVIGLALLIAGCGGDSDRDREPRGPIPGSTINFYNDVVEGHSINLTLKTDLPESSTGVVSFNNREWTINANGSADCNLIDTSDIHDTGCDLNVDVENGFLSFSYNHNVLSEAADDKMYYHNERSNIHSVTLDFEGYAKHFSKCKNTRNNHLKRTELVREDEKKPNSPWTIDKYHDRFYAQSQEVACNTAFMSHGFTQTRLTKVGGGSYTDPAMQITVKAGTTDEVYLRYMKPDYYGFLSFSPASVVTENGYEKHDFGFLNGELDVAGFWPYIDIIVKPRQGVSLDDTQLTIFNQFDRYQLVAGESPLILDSNESYLALRATYNYSRYSRLVAVNKVIGSDRPSSFDNATILSAQHTLTQKVKNTRFRGPIPPLANDVASPRTATNKVAKNSQDEVKLTFSENVTLMSANHLVEQEYNSTDTLSGRTPHINENLTSADLHISFGKHVTENIGTSCCWDSFGNKENIDLNFNFWDANGQFQSKRTQRVFTLSSSYVDIAGSLSAASTYGPDFWSLVVNNNIILLPATGKLIPIKNILRNMRQDYINILNTNVGTKIHDQFFDAHYSTIIPGSGGFGSPGVINAYLQEQSDLVKDQQVLINKSNRHKRYKYVFTGAYVNSNYKPRLVKSGTATASLSCKDVKSYGQYYISGSKIVSYLQDLKNIECEIADFSGKGNLSVEMTYGSVVNRKADLLFAVDLPVYTNVVMDAATAALELESDLIHYDLTFSSGIKDSLGTDDFTLVTTGDVTADIVDVIPDADVPGNYRVTISSATGDGTLKLVFADNLEAIGYNGLQVDFENTSYANFPTIVIGSPATLPPSTIEYVGEPVLDTGTAVFTLKLSRQASELTPTHFELITTGSVAGKISDITENLDGTYSVNLTSLSGEGSLTVKVLGSSINYDGVTATDADFVSNEVTVDVKSYVKRAVIVSW